MKLRETLDDPATAASVDYRAMAHASPLLGVYAALRQRDGKSHAEAVAFLRDVDPNCDIDAELEKFDQLSAAASTAR